MFLQRSIFLVLLPKYGNFHFYGFLNNASLFFDICVWYWFLSKIILLSYSGSGFFPWPAEMQATIPNIQWFSMVHIKNSFAHFWGITKYYSNFNFETFVDDCSLILRCIRKFFAYYLLTSLWFFWNGKLCHACARLKLTIFRNWTPKNMPDWQKCAGFQK